MNATTEKAAWRERMALRRANVDSAARAVAALTACRTVLGLTVIGKAKTLGCFVSLADEPDTRTLFEAWWQAGRCVGAPVYDPARGLYGLARVDDATVWRRGPLGVREPREPHRLSMAQVDAMVVPGVAFDLHGIRLGRGGGHIDRLLAGWRGARIGLAFDNQVVERLPTETHDVAMDYVVTERRIITSAGTR